jgi:Polyketide cyclase / dehydrase and lipid transport
MASIRVQAVIDCSPEHAWDALRDFGALHTRLAPGFVTDVRLDGEDRVVTFAVGTTVREVLIDRDDDLRRLAWSIVDGPYTHHNGVAQVFAEPDGRALFVWTTDLLPNELAARTAEMMTAGIAAITRTLAGSAVRA